MSARDHATEAAARLGQIIVGRDESHGDWRSNAKKAQGIKEHLTGIEDPVLREAGDAIACKLARAASGGEYTEDTWLDIEGYAVLAVGHIRQQDGSNSYGGTD